MDLKMIFVLLIKNDFLNNYRNMMNLYCFERDYSCRKDDKNGNPLNIFFFLRYFVFWCSSIRIKYNIASFSLIIYI